MSRDHSPADRCLGAWHVRFTPESGHRQVYSITSSASASNLPGICRPRDLAVLRLIVRSNLVGCRIGRSAGWAGFISNGVRAERNRCSCGLFVSADDRLNVNGLFDAVVSNALAVIFCEHVKRWRFISTDRGSYRAPRAHSHGQVWRRVRRSHRWSR
jgi:hypothetical protein